MKERLQQLKTLINEGQTEAAISELNLLKTSASDTIAAEAYYLLGNAYRKQGNWQQALNHYQEAIHLNPESPAMEARAMVMDILNFYNKDMFNQ